MTQKMNLGEGACCGPKISDLRRITFPDGFQVGIIGLDAVMEALYKEGKPPDDATAMEIVDRLQEHNYIVASDRKVYQKAMMGEYQTFFRRKKKIDDAAAGPASGS